MEAKSGRRWLMIYALMFTGGILLIGGWSFDRAGNPDNIFPLWVPVLGLIVMSGGLYLWLINR